MGTIRYINDTTHQIHNNTSNTSHLHNHNKNLGQVDFNTTSSYKTFCENSNISNISVVNQSLPQTPSSNQLKNTTCVDNQNSSYNSTNDFNQNSHHVKLESLNNDFHKQENA